LTGPRITCHTKSRLSITTSKEKGGRGLLEVVKITVQENETWTERRKAVDEKPNVNMHSSQNRAAERCFDIKIPG